MGLEMNGCEWLVYISCGFLFALIVSAAVFKAVVMVGIVIVVGLAGWLTLFF